MQQSIYRHSGIVLWNYVIPKTFLEVFKRRQRSEVTEDINWLSVFLSHHVSFTSLLPFHPFLQLSPLYKVEQTACV